MKLHKLSVTFLCSALYCSTIFAQTNTYFVQFVDKQQKADPNVMLSAKSIDRRAKFNIPFIEEDYAVNTDYVRAVTMLDSTHIRYTLKWPNGVVVNSTREDSARVAQFAFVKKVSYVGQSERAFALENPGFITPVLKLKESSMRTENLSKKDYGVAFTQNQQIQVTDMHQSGFDGSGVVIAVFDAGFNAIDKIPSFLKHQANGLLTFGYDVAGLDNELNIKENHGTAVTSSAGGYDFGNYIGSAPKAQYLLFRTEYEATEYPIEELNWCKAAELADSVGVDIISSSLGYNQFDDKSLSYSHQDLDGKTTYISHGARIASQKGIIVLNSAGNSGDNAWRKIGTPADVPTVLSVGAVDAKGEPGKFTSHGHNALGEIKPDIAAMGVLASVASPKGTYYQGYGTSYSTPIAAGGVACLVQAFPDVHPEILKKAIRLTASLSRHPDSLSGYGVAQFYTAKEYLTKSLENSPKQLLSTTKNAINIYSGNAQNIQYEVLRHKKFLLVFTTKKKIAQGQDSCQDGFFRINLEEIELKCSQIYTVKIVLTDAEETHTIKKTDIYNCLD